MAFPFLTARWQNICLLTYTAPPRLLEPRVPPGLALETRDGRGFVSLVAFQFLHTRVLGVPWPGYRNFAEINLRFYVRHGQERGVVFIREFVPQRLVAWLARAVYNEPYRAAPVYHNVSGNADSLQVEYRLNWQGRNNTVAVEGRLPATEPSPATDEHFFKEHHWGFGVDRRGRTISYRVEHSVWKTYLPTKYEVNFNWDEVYGSEWGFLAEATPLSVILAAGSDVAVYAHGRCLLDGQEAASS